MKVRNWKNKLLFSLFHVFVSNKKINAFPILTFQPLMRTNRNQPCVYQFSKIKTKQITSSTSNNIILLKKTNEFISLFYSPSVTMKKEKIQRKNSFISFLDLSLLTFRFHKISTLSNKSNHKHTYNDKDSKWKNGTVVEGIVALRIWNCEGAFPRRLDSLAVRREHATRLVVTEWVAMGRQRAMWNEQKCGGSDFACFLPQTRIFLWILICWMLMISIRKKTPSPVMVMNGGFYSGILRSWI